MQRFPARAANRYDPLYLHIEDIAGFIQKNTMKLYMVIERFLPGCKERVYERFNAEGRMLPEGLAYIDSWLEKDGNRCFQLMKTADPRLFRSWCQHGCDLIDFEVVEIGQTPSGSPATRSAIRYPH